MAVSQFNEKVPVDTIMKEWTDIVLKLGITDYTLMTFDSYYTSRKSIELLQSLPGILYLGSIQENKFSPVAGLISDKVTEPKEHESVWNPKTNQIVQCAWAPKDKLGKKFTIANCFRYIEDGPDTSEMMYLHDLYKVTFKDCDIFNRNLNHRCWPFRCGGGGRFGEHLRRMDFFFSSVLQNVHNLWMNADFENRSEVTFHDIMVQLADAIFSMIGSDPNKTTPNVSSNLEQDPKTSQTEEPPRKRHKADTKPSDSTLTLSPETKAKHPFGSMLKNSGGPNWSCCPDSLTYSVLISLMHADPHQLERPKYQQNMIFDHPNASLSFLKFLKFTYQNGAVGLQRDLWRSGFCQNFIPKKTGYCKTEDILDCFKASPTGLFATIRELSFCCTSSCGYTKTHQDQIIYMSSAREFFIEKPADALPILRILAYPEKCPKCGLITAPKAKVVTVPHVLVLKKLWEDITPELIFGGALFRLSACMWFHRDHQHFVVTFHWNEQWFYYDDLASKTPITCTSFNPPVADLERNFQFYCNMD